MPKDKREFCGVIRVRIDTRSRKLELAPAEDWGGPDGLFRVRIGRRWLNTPEGKPLFFDRVRPADLIAGEMFGEQAAVLPGAPPDLPSRSRVTVKFWKDGLPHYEGTYTWTPPFRGFDGRFYVFVTTFEAGTIMVPVEDVTLKRRPGK